MHSKNLIFSAAASQFVCKVLEKWTGTTWHWMDSDKTWYRRSTL